MISTVCSRKASYSIETMIKVYSVLKIFKCVVAHFRYEKLEMIGIFLLMCTMNMACNLCFSLLLCGIDCLSYHPRKIFSRNCKKLNCFCTLLHRKASTPKVQKILHKQTSCFSILFESKIHM